MNSKKSKYMVWSAFLACLLCIPLVTNNYHQYVINLIFINFLVCLGLGIVFGYSGQLAFVSAAFLGIGAYTVGLLMVRFGISFWIGILLAGLLSLVIAVLLTLIALRLKRYYLAITTICFTLCMRFFYINVPEVSLGPAGFNVPPATFLGFSFDTDHRVYYLVLVFVLLFSVLSLNIIRSKIGRALMAIRGNEDAAAAASIDVKKYRMLAFAMCGVLGGIAGGLYTQVLGRITPDEFGVLPSILHFVIVALAGFGSFYGLIASTVIITLIPELTRAFADYQELLYGAILISIILVAPDGLYGFILKVSHMKWREKLYGSV